MSKSVQIVEINNSTVSVIIPSYNNANYIVAALDSVYNQAVDFDLQIIVVDDGSTDNTSEVLLEYTSTGNRQLNYIVQKNAGPAAARNKGIESATGKYIAFLDADDEWLPGHLQKTVSFLEQGDFDWVATGYYKRLPDGSQQYRTFIDDSYMYERKSGRVQLLSRGLFFFSSAPIWTGTLLFSSSCLKSLGGFDPSFRIGEDWDLYLRAEEAGFACGFLDEATAIYNHNPNSITKSKQYNGLVEHLRLAQKHAQILGMKNQIIKESYADYLWDTARCFASNGDYRRAGLCCFHSLFVSFEPKRLYSLARRKLTLKESGGSDAVK